MFEFVCGFFTGILITFLRRTENRSIGIQAEEVWSQPVQSQPILIQNSKTNFVSNLKNFWGPDS